LGIVFENHEDESPTRQDKLALAVARIDADDGDLVGGAML
jgi:hypothetical protein